jgi:hypothetical protein
MATSAYAQAPQRERIALHPCVITGGRKANTADLEATCATAAIRETMNLVPSTEVRAYLDERERGSCARLKNRNACLRRLAIAIQASRILYITLNPFTPKSTRITGIVVDDTGAQVEEKTLELPRIARQPPRDVVRFAVSQLLDQLDVAKAPAQDILPVPRAPGEPAPEPEVAIPTPAPEPAPTVTPAPQPPAASVSTQQEAARGRTWKTPAGIAGMAAGGVGLIVSGILVVSSNSKANEFNDAFKDGLPPSTDTAQLARLRDDAESQRRTAAIAAGAGAALAIGGAILWLTDRPSSGSSSPDKAGTARLLAGPGQVGVLVLLP